MLMMDEPTSNMDNRSELYIRQKLLKLRADQTLLLVTHRTSMLEVVDRIIVLEQGRIIVDGPKTKVLQQLKSGQVRHREARYG